MRRFPAVALAALVAFASVPARAEPAIGSAASVEKDVRGETDSRAVKIVVGDEIFPQEVLITGSDSRGKFVFQDRTDLQLGPSSKIKLDNFVYSSGKNGVVFNAAKGVFRFVSAPGEHKDYTVRTPNATIGVRGTSFGVRVLFGRTDAVLYDGVIEVCPIGGGACRTIGSPCSFVSVGGGGVTPPRTLGRNDWSFDDSCGAGGGGNRGNRTQRANATEIPSDLEALLRAYPAGGEGLADAIAGALLNDPSATTAVVALAEKGTPAQKGAIAAGVLRALDRMQTSNPDGARTIRDALMQSDSVFRAILAALESQTGGNDLGFGRGNLVFFPGSGGFSSGGGGGSVLASPVVSPN